ncbi:efflux RND transporter periplasmic adaptor subunit [Roseibium aggregatum]|uniref:Efflux RND transporter periplasmic adaptor subunit n=1 Tax=Roseibium aggregatum TaxID=187304 RepID=A0A939J5U3_9HYPH|nr:efflux RND transporter periplasmic adaptor subunit [Roseibium aggregatum]MBN9672089.1 efflux RND transporter periplasmic adaptor subunit [Roseibium aggregatum]
MTVRASRRKKLFLVLVLATGLSAVGYYFRGSLLPAEETTAYLTAQATRGDVEETVLATGILKPRKLVAVGAQVSGRITALHVELGQEVEEGDLIAEIDSVTQENDLRTAEASLAQVKAELAEQEANLVLAQSTFARQTKLSSQNATAQADLESAEADMKAVEAQIDSLKAQIISAEVAVETAQANLDYTRITTPISGTVLAVVSQEGQTVNATQSAPTIVIIGQLDVMTVRAEISEADIVKVKAGQEVSFSIIGAPDVTYTSQLESIEPAPESITSDSSITSSTSSSSSSSSTSTSAIYYNGIFHVPNPEGMLRTYMTAEVHIVLGRAEDVLTIPAAALKSGSSTGAYAVQVLDPSGSVAIRAVEAGLNDKITVEILSGIEEGDRVILGERTGASAATSSRRPGPPMGL